MAAGAGDRAGREGRAVGDRGQRRRSSARSTGRQEADDHRAGLVRGQRVGRAARRAGAREL